MSKRPQILFVLNEQDLHSELVIPYLDREPIIFDPANIPDGVELSYFNKGNQQYIIIDDKVIDNVGAIWWRKLIDRSTENLPEKKIERTYGDRSFVEYVRHAIRIHTSNLGAFFGNAYWVSNPYHMLRANNKTWQLRVAYSVGMSVPQTLQTSSTKRAKEFVKQQRGTCIVKSVSNYFPVRADGTELMFWSQKIHSGQKISYEGLHLAPAIFQKAIDGIDIRITVVGDKVFGSKITIDDSKLGGIRDWRVIGQGVKGKPLFEPHKVPDKLRIQCLNMVKKLGLSYGAYDFFLIKRVHIGF